MGREASITRIIGPENYARLQHFKCLIVGAGGIGSELLKDCILMGFGEIHIVDLDTIDLSNLNRQFLFRQKDIKQPKSTTAVKAVQHFSNSKLIPYQGNVMDTKQFPLHWFSQFDIFLNGLDNLAARRYVNKISQFLKKPLIESGTSGFDGYIQPILPGITECFDCTKKETPKTFPVCTIRSTPSQPIHCIVWAKNFLFNQLFTSDQSPTAGDSDDNDWGTDDKEEISRIKQETNELHDLQQVVHRQDKAHITDILKKLFIKDIEKLLQLDNLWKSRAKPVPLSESLIESTRYDHDSTDLSAVWGLEKQINQFIRVTGKLMDRISQEQYNIEFDKDDQDTLIFVATAANIRSHIFGIPIKTVFDIKQIAGNIIPAIATTNAIVAGLSTLTSLRLLNLLPYDKASSGLDVNMAFTARASNLSKDRYLSNPKLAPPNCNCAVCSKVARGVIKITIQGLEKLTLSQFIEMLKKQYGYPSETSLIDTSDQRLLVDFDFEDLLNRTLSQAKLRDGSVILFSDEEGDEREMYKQPLELYLDVVEDNAAALEVELPSLQIALFKPQKQDEKEEQEMTKEKSPANEENKNGIVILDEEENRGEKDNTATKRPRSPDQTLQDTKKAKTSKSSEYAEDIIELD
ncbi:E1 ubiquitin-activating protein uba2 [Zygosaccharomyces mellis]|uniref:Ubiquitin-activating enzyme E1-like n=1 Tax=Zygosaccharomyces mellis TaxID=42258 RepID=A0A4C2E139_9SACH|nr:E1 ubiquitin-activating protein uba2 [Zygosaccharomyces mellis]